MNIEMTDRAKEKFLLMKGKNISITLMKYPVGWAGYKYKIVSAKQTGDDNLYEVDGFEIIVSKDSEIGLKGVRIDYGGLLFKDFIVYPKFS